jgi:hypothetical protein
MARSRETESANPAAAPASARRRVIWKLLFFISTSQIHYCN